MGCENLVCICTASTLPGALIHALDSADGWRLLFYPGFRCAVPEAIDMLPLPRWGSKPNMDAVFLRVTVFKLQAQYRWFAVLRSILSESYGYAAPPGQIWMVTIMLLICQIPACISQVWATSILW